MLFLDELPEFGMRMLEVMRQPMEDKLVTKYQKRISGPLLDRIDIQIEVPRVEFEELSEKRLGEPSAVIQGRVGAAC